MTLSVIVCVYNTKIEYFENCLRSLRTESLGKEIEICVVDDGSSVDYSPIIQKYGLKYKKTENRGILAARLTGIEMASGDCIAFCDSDDTVSFDFHRPMLECMKSENADIVTNDWAFHTDKSRYFCKRDVTICTDIAVKGREVIEKFFEPEGRQHSLFVLWNKVFRADVLRRAAEAVSKTELCATRCNYAEDVALNFFAFLEAKSFFGVHTGYYFYRVHSEQTVGVISSERLRLQVAYMVKTLNIMERELSVRRLSALLPKLQSWREMMARNHYSHAMAKGYTELYAFIKDSYGVGKLQRSRFSDSRVYAKNTLLADNFEEIDATLCGIYLKEDSIAVSCSPKNRYAMRTLKRLINEGKEIRLDNTSAIRIPNAEISLKNRVLHNFFIYFTGTLLFPKGSRLREFLKSKF